MYSPIFIKNENQLNKVLKFQRKTKQDLGVLFVSLWDQHSEQLVDRLKQKRVSGKKPLYVVNSFTMPHAFVIFKTSKVPHLIQFKKGTLESEDYLSMIYKELGL